MLKFRDDPRRFTAGLVSLLIAAQTTAALIHKPPAGREVQIFAGLAVLAFFLLAKFLLKLRLFRRQEEQKAFPDSRDGFRYRPYESGTQQAPTLPITLTSRLPIRILLLTGIFFILPGAIAAVAMIPMLPDRTAFIVIILGGGGSVFFSWLLCRGIRTRIHPNTVILNRDGLSLSIFGKKDFVAWNEIASFRSAQTGNNRPPSASIVLTQSAAQKRGAGYSALSRRKDIIKIPGYWQSDDSISTSDLVNELERYRQYFASNPAPT